MAGQKYQEKVVNYFKIYKYTNVDSFSSSEELFKNMSKNPVFVIIDYLLKEESGIDVMIKAKKISPNAEFIFLSDNDSIDIAINCMKNGASEYIFKDNEALHKMMMKIQKINTLSKLAEKNARFKTGVVLFFVLIGILIIATLILMFNQG